MDCRSSELHDEKFPFMSLPSDSVG